MIGFDLATPPHPLGSTHGESRVIREAYFEGPLYVPLVQRAYDAWAELEAESERKLLVTTGGLLLGTTDGSLVAGTRLSADRHGLHYEVLSAGDIRKHYPMFNVSDKVVGLYEPRSGVLLPEECVVAQLSIAQAGGAEFHVEEPVESWKPDGEGVIVSTGKGTYRAEKLLLTPGAWLKRLLTDVDLPLSVERQVLYWFEPEQRPEQFLVGTMPFFAWEYGPESLFYGIPNLNSGLKVAFHHQGVVSDPEEIDRDVSPNEIATMTSLLAAAMPDVGDRIVRAEVCMYTNTPDENFLIDFHPGFGQVLIASCCSGHGFKFASVIGEILADLLIDGKTEHDIAPFRLGRFEG